MPNHVRQRLSVVGTADNIAAFVATARGANPSNGDPHGSSNWHAKLTIKPLCFHLIAPLPDAFSEAPYGSNGSVGYQAEIAGWGVKWGSYDIDDDAPRYISFPGGMIAVYDFTCAWSPPVEALRRASLRYPMLCLFLSWGGEGPCRGRHVFDRGRVVLEVCDDYARDISPEMPTDAEYETDEDAAASKRDVVENKYIACHDNWVSEFLVSGMPVIGVASAQSRAPEYVAAHESLRALDLTNGATVEDVHRAFRRRAASEKAHPDQGGSADRFAALVKLRDAAIAAISGRAEREVP